jgi:hypothetical protein
MKQYKYYLYLKQEHLYYNSIFINKRWYRRLFGGTWRLIKLGKDTPYINLFCVWTKIPLSKWGGSKEVLEIEHYPETEVYTKYMLFKEFFKQLFNKNQNEKT